MQSRTCLLMVACALLPQALAAQATPATTAPAPAPAPAAAASANPVSDALRNMEQRSARNLIAAAELMPADKYTYRPTPAQMSFAQIQVHLANEGNDVLCSKTAGVPAPQRTAVDSTATKEQLVARLKETFQFCEQAFAKMDDSKLAEPISMFGMNLSRATAVLITVGDWADHYSQEANYLRLNGILPPTAQRRSM
jgi:DinB family protein